jgi:L-rhamnose mutarotase
MLKIYNEMKEYTNKMEQTEHAQFIDEPTNEVFPLMSCDNDNEFIKFNELKKSGNKIPQELKHYDLDL